MIKNRSLLSGTDGRLSDQFLVWMCVPLLVLGVGLCVQFLWLPPVSVLLLYWQVVAMTGLSCGLFLWLVMASRTLSPKAVWHQRILQGAIIIWPVITVIYWGFLEQMRLLLIGSDMLGIFALGSYWLMTAISGLILLYVCWQASSLLFQLAQHIGNHHHTKKKHQDSND